MEDVFLSTERLNRIRDKIRSKIPNRVRKLKSYKSLVLFVKKIYYILLLFRSSRIYSHLTGRGSLMDVVQKLHLVHWSKLHKARREQLAWVVTKMLEHRNYEYERRVFDAKVVFNGDPESLSIDQYCPYFFRNKELVLSLIDEFQLEKATELVKTLDKAGHYYTPFYYKRSRQTAEINLFYAYRHLALKTYHNGEGRLIPALATKIAAVQKKLQRYLPAPSKGLKVLLEKIGVELPDLKLLSPDWSALIGHNGHLNVHLMMHKMGWWQGSPAILAYKNRIANPPFLSLFSSFCPTFILDENIPSDIWHELASLTPFLGVSHQLFTFDDGRAMYWNDAGAMAVKEWEDQDRGFPLREVYDSRFNTDETNTTFSQLRKKWGLKPSDWHVCLHMRDAQTRNETEGTGESIRNTALENYIAAIRYITDQGGWVIRMGGNKAPKLPPMHQVIDYAHSPDQSALMDLHLVRKARLFIGTTSGFAYVASSFGIPTAMVNAISSVGLLWSKDTRFALKPVQTREGRLLSQQEAVSEKWRWAYPTHECLARAGLSVRENTPDEILETVKEVFQLVTEGTSSATYPLLDAWRASMPLPGFYGSALPSRYFLEKYADSFLTKDYIEV